MQRALSIIMAIKSLGIPFVQQVSDGGTGGQPAGAQLTTVKRFSSTGFKVAPAAYHAEANRTIL